MKRISILGATGSVGTQTLNVIKKHKDSFKLIAVSANNNSKKLIGIIEEFNPKFAVLTDLNAYNETKKYCRDKNINIEILFGIEGLNIIASLDEVDLVVTAVVGMIGLIPTMEAIKAKKSIALANKETLVVAGELVIKEATAQGVKILPVDSEHSAIFQCLQGNNSKDINKILLTASGGPFRGKSKEFLENVTVADALKHPKWNMGKKISIDSSTLMNKGLEIIEARWLFGVDYDKIQVVVHPQSIVHSMVEYNDGSVIAQLSNADMRLPIQYALNYPNRLNTVIEPLDFFALKQLTFERPDLETFYALNLAIEAGKIGGIMPTILNAANEAAVALFLMEKIKFLDIPKLIEESMNKFYYTSTVSIENIIDTDKEVKKYLFKKIQ